MANLQNIGINHDKSRDSYWFAHGGIEEQSQRKIKTDVKSSDDAKEQQLQKDKEKKMRIFRELQEGERLKKLKDLEQQFLMSKKHHEQLEEERRRKIEEARLKEMERRHQVEERKRQIWEAEQERKEAILRRNMEREARIEARRNAQRNSQSFAFGSSTPRTFDLDLAAIGRSINPGSLLMSSVSYKRSEERDLGPPRATSACSLDRKLENSSHGENYSKFALSAPSEPMYPNNLCKQIAMLQKSSDGMKACLSMWESDSRCLPNFFSYSGCLLGSGVLVGEDCMSRSMISLSSSAFRGRKRTDIMPILSRERSATPHITPRGNLSARAVSMNRLDQLAQPRRTYLYARNQTAANTTTTINGGPRTVSPSMSKSMCNLANQHPTMGRRVHAATAPANYKRDMSKSMMHLADGPSPRDNRGLPPSPPQPKSGMRPSQSMLHLASPPRLTRAARLRAQALASNRAVSAWNLNKTEPTGNNLFPGKDASRSPSRPQSSMSGTSEISATSSSVSAVNMRIRPAPRRPRPVSVAGSIADSSVHSMVKRELQRQPQLHDKNAPTIAHKSDRTKISDKDGNDSKDEKSLPLKKPVPPPKSSAVLARAKSHPVPMKDNLRKVQPSQDVKEINSKETKEVVKQKEKLIVQSSEKIDCKRKPESDLRSDSDCKAMSPTNDKETSFSSDSKAKIESESLSQSRTDSEIRIQNLSSSTSVNIASKSTPSESLTESQTPNIPVEIAQKVEKPVQSLSESISESVSKDATSSKPRITSEEEAKAALAEKRRLAREQAEREAEIERQRLEEIRRKEEEQQKLEEAEQKRMEEEQIRLAELHRQLEEEKLKKAIEERQLKEREEEEKRIEELKQKAEREEQEKKAREEAEKQRIELEEKLRKEEEERAERKKRVEQIMARTRNKMAQSPATTPNENNSKLGKSAEVSNNSSENKNSILPFGMSNGKTASNNYESDLGEKMQTPENLENSLISLSSSFSIEKHTTALLPDLLNSETNHTSRVNGILPVNSEQLNQPNDLTSFSNSANVATSPHSNGYSSHEEMSCTTSPEENPDADLLIDIQSCQQKFQMSPTSTDFTKLVDLEPPSLDNNITNENFLINVDNFNSNILNSDSYDSLQKKQDATIPDLLS